MIGVLIAAAALAAPDTALMALLERARLEVPDAREIADLQICPPNRNGDQWVALSRPRQARAYYRAVWRDGRPVRLIDLQISGAAQGLEGLAARTMERRVSACPWVSADQLDAAWAALDRPR